MKNKETKEWFETSMEDYTSAIYLNKGHPKSVCVISYLCAQAAEKLLKGYLTENSIEFEYNHNISLLLNKCIGKDNNFNLLIQSCDFLNSFTSSNLRYPPKMQVTEKEAEYAIICVEKIKQFEPIKKIEIELNISIPVIQNNEDKNGGGKK